MLYLTKDEQDSLRRLSQHPDFGALKKILQAWLATTDTITDIDLSNAAAEVAGRRQTVAAIKTLLADLSVIDPPRNRRVDTHE